MPGWPVASFSQNGAGGRTSVTLTVPASTSVGDLIWVTVYKENQDSVTDPAGEGYTLYDSSTNTGSTPDFDRYHYYKIAVSGDASQSHVWSWTNGTWAGSGMVVFGGLTSTPINAFQATVQTTASTSHVAPTVTPSSITRHIELFSNAAFDNAGGTIPVPLTEVASSGETESYYYRRDTASATGTRTTTWGTSAQYTASHVILEEDTAGVNTPWYVDSGAVASAASGNITPALPSSWAVDDILILAVHSSDNVTHSITATNGTWTQISQSNNTTAQRVSLWWSRGVASHSNPQVNHTAGAAIIGQVHAIRGCLTGSSPIRGSASLDANAASATISSVAATSITAGDLVLWQGFYEDDPTTWTVPTMWAAGPVVTTTQGNDAALGLRYRPQATTGSTEAPSVTVSGGTFANSVNVSIIVALQPATAGTNYPVSIGGTLTTAGSATEMPALVRGGTLALAGAVSLPLDPYPTEVMADSPVGYWRLGEPSGTTAEDISGNNIDGTYTGGFTLGATGATVSDSDTAVTLNGSTGYIALPTNSLLDDTGPITIEAWVKTTSTDSHDNIWGGYKDGTWEGVGFRLLNGSTPSYYSSATGNWTEASSGGVNDGNWHHLAVTVSGTLVSFYIDGAAAGTATNAQPGSYSGVRAIGARSNGSIEHLGGTIDEVAFYSTALSSTRIAAHFNAAGGGTTFPVSIGGTLTSAGALQKQDNLIRAGTLSSAATITKANAQAAFAGTLSSAGSLLKATSRSLAGTLSSAGALAVSKVKVLAFAGSLSSAGAFVKANLQAAFGGTLATTGALTKANAQAAFGGTLATAGALLKSSTRSLAGTLASAGAFVGTKVLLLARSGGLTPAGAISRLNALVRAGTLASSGVIQRVNAQAPFTGTLTTAGALASIKAKLLSFAGDLSSAGAVLKRPAISRAGTTATAGAVVKTTGKAAGGTLATSATLDAGSTGPILVGVSGALTTAGAFAKTTGRLLAGTLASVGVIRRAITRIIQAVLSPGGALTKSSTRQATATVGLGGGLAASRVMHRSYAGALTLGGAASQEYTRAPQIFQANGILSPTGTILVDLQHVPIPKPPEAMLVLPETDPPEPIGR